MTFHPEKHHRRSIRLQEYDYTQPGAYFVTICTYQRQCLFGEIIDGAMHLNACGEIVQACWNNLPNHFPFIELDAFIIMPNHIHGIIILTEQMVDAGVGVDVEVDVGVGVGVGAKHSCPDVSNSPKALSKNASPCPGISNYPKTSPCPDVSNYPKTLSKNASPCPGISNYPKTLSKNTSPYLDVSSPLPPKGTQSGSLGAIVQNFKSVSTRKINRINSTSGETIWQRNYHDRIIRDEKSLHHIQQYITENPHAWTQDPENPQKLTHPYQ
jgi:REP element-mobilizing transposase RayT